MSEAKLPSGSDPTVGGQWSVDTAPTPPAFPKSAPEVVALDERLADWSSMAQGAFAANTLRAWRADWGSRGMTRSDLRAGVVHVIPLHT